MKIKLSFHKNSKMWNWAVSVILRSTWEKINFLPDSFSRIRVSKLTCHDFLADVWQVQKVSCCWWKTAPALLSPVPWNLCDVFSPLAAGLFLLELAIWMIVSPENACLQHIFEKSIRLDSCVFLHCVVFCSIQVDYIKIVLFGYCFTCFLGIASLLLLLLLFYLCLTI